MGYDFHVEYKKGCDNIMVDALSRRHDIETTGGPSFGLSQLVPHWLEAIKDEVAIDYTLQVLQEKIQQGEALGPWKLVDGIILFKDRIYFAMNSKLALAIIKEFHGSTHEGYVKTLQRIKSKFYWKEMSTSWHLSVRKTPFEIVYGRSPQRLLSYVPGTAKVEAVKQELKSRDQILKEVRDCIALAQARMKKIYDSKHKEREFKAGDFVYLKLQL
ncbi:hypothetical protein LWI28_004616 [Acer negundo]|uniref:Integrase zinc-binding domain-containing protein n=1 Tax=Acer negundo TaxID=4023 RepID=A0AAD5ICY0_ACENE|nr:hypothetical protein LWI28_004616 [Acer negundo]